MHTNIENRKKEAVRLVFWYPGIFLVLVIFFGAFATAGAGKLNPHDLGNAARGMTALGSLAFALAILGYLKLRKCLYT